MPTSDETIINRLKWMFPDEYERLRREKDPEKYKGKVFCGETARWKDIKPPPTNEEIAANIERLNRIERKRLNRIEKEQKHVERKPKRNIRQGMHKVKPLILSRDGFKCVKCKSIEGLAVHHIVALSKGGTHESTNLITLCELCHYDVHSKEPVGKFMLKSIGRY